MQGARPRLLRRERLRTLYGDLSTASCSSAGHCKSLGTACTSATECCSNACVSGVRSGASSCTLLGDTCSSSGQCCSGECVGGRCTFYNYCRGGGDVCSTGTDCCDGICDAATHRCALPWSSACVPTNEPCSGLRSCCNTACVDSGLGTGSGYCYPIGGCKTYKDYCTKDQDCCSGSCGVADSSGLRRCARVGSCVPDGDVCGGLGASQNCCSGGKSGCHTSSTGVSRCIPNFGGTCYSNGAPCSLGDECCSKLCLPAPASSTGFTCGATCLAIGSGTCTTDSDCCSGGVCQSGICQSGGTSCVAYGGSCTASSQCCSGNCLSGTCQFN